MFVDVSIPKNPPKITILRSLTITCLITSKISMHDYGGTHTFQLTHLPFLGTMLNSSVASSFTFNLKNHQIITPTNVAILHSSHLNLHNTVLLLWPVSVRLNPFCDNLSLHCMHA